MYNIITMLGLDMMRNVLAGNQTIMFTRAIGGNGLTKESGLPATTALPRVNQTFSITELIQGERGPELLIRIASAGLETAYTLHQIGIYARLDDGEEVLFQVVQYENGINLPAKNDATRFNLDMKIAIASLGNDDLFRIAAENCPRNT